MASEKVTIDFELSGDIAQELDEVNQKLNETEQSTNDLGQASSNSGDAITTKMNPALIAGAAALAGLGIAAKEVFGFLKDSILAYEEQADVNARLAASIDDTGMSSEQLSATFNKQQKIIGDLAQATRFGDEAISGAAASLQNMTGVAIDSADGQRLLQTALDVSAATGKDLTGVTEKLAKARNGDIAAIKELVPLTKEQQKELDGIEDASTRALAAQELLSEAYGGTAEQLGGGFFGALKNVQDALGDTQQAVGGLIVDSGALTPVIEGVNDVFLDLQGFLADNKEEIQQFVKNGVLFVLDGFVSFFDLLDKGAPILEGIIGWFRIAFNISKIVRNGIFALGGAFLALYTKGISIAANGIAEFIEKIKPLAEFSDTIAGIVDSAQGGLEKISKGADEASKFFTESAKEDAEDVKDAFKGIGEVFTGAGGITGQIRDAADTIRNRIANIREEVEKSKAVVEELEQIKNDAGLTPDEENKLAEAKAKVVEKEKELTEEKKKQKELKEDEVDENEILRERIELIQQQTEAINGTIGALDAFGDVGSNFGGILSSINQTVGKFRELEAAGKDGAAAIAGGLSATGRAAAGFAESMGASAALQAGILSAFETAAGFASLAIFDYFGAANHFISAGIYAGVAATSGGGGSVQKKSVNQSAGGASAGGSAGGGSPDFEDIADLQAQKIAEAMGTEGGGTSQIVINLGGANVFSDDPQTYRTLFDGIESEARNRGVILGNN